MKALWRGQISLSISDSLKDISFFATTDDGPTTSIPAGASLRFLSIVEAARIPLYLTAGPKISVATSSQETEQWFSSILLGQDGSDHAWWHTARPDSPLAILVSVDISSDVNRAEIPAVTELLFFASNGQPTNLSRPLTPPPSTPVLDETEDARTNEAPILRLWAVPISSDLLFRSTATELTPPSSPISEHQEIVARFLPSPFESLQGMGEVINRPSVRKRKSVNEFFDEADERRRKARRKGGESVTTAAASKAKSENSFPTLQHSRSLSNSQSASLRTGQLSRASSVTSTRPGSAREQSISGGLKPSALSRVHDNSISFECTSEVSIESKNKQLVSRHVMAGMRLYGLSQSKSAKSRANSAAASPTVDTSFQDMETKQKNDEEYKLIYHQVFKGTCFAFRKHIAVVNFQPIIENIQDTVDKLLAVFCNDPLGKDTGYDDDKLTPGGRNVFGTEVTASVSEKR